MTGHALIDGTRESLEPIEEVVCFMFQGINTRPMIITHEGVIRIVRQILFERGSVIHCHTCHDETTILR